MHEVWWVRGIPRETDRLPELVDRDGILKYPWKFAGGVAFPNCSKIGPSVQTMRFGMRITQLVKKC